MWIAIAICLWALGLVFFLRVFHIVATQDRRVELMMQKEMEENTPKTAAQVLRKLRKTKIYECVRLRETAIEQENFDAVRECNSKLRILLHGLK